MSETETEFGELDVHSVFENRPELFESVLGVRIKPETVVHHHPVDRREVDFVLQDILGNHYVIEVKFQYDPLEALSQVMVYKKLYRKQNSGLSREKVIPVVLIDTQSVSNDDRDVFGEHNIKLAVYDTKEIKTEYKKLKAEVRVLPTRIEFPQIDSLSEAVKSISKFKDNYFDLNILLEGFRKYHAFDDFWNWKRGEGTFWWPSFIFKLQLLGNVEDALWITFLEALTDDHQVARGIYEEGWNWQKITSTPLDDFQNYLDNTTYRLTKIVKTRGLTKGEIIAGIVGKYLSKVQSVSKSQEDYFLKIIEDAETQYEAYEMIIKDLERIKGVGSWVARAFATWSSVRKLLPVSPTEKVRISGNVIKAIERMNLRKPGEKTEETILRIARKYGVSPELIERGLFRIVHG